MEILYWRKLIQGDFTCISTVVVLHGIDLKPSETVTYSLLLLAEFVFTNYALTAYCFMIGRNKYEARESETPSYLSFDVICHPTLDMNLEYVICDASTQVTPKPLDIVPEFQTSLYLALVLLLSLSSPSCSLAVSLSFSHSFSPSARDKTLSFMRCKANESSCSAVL